MANFSSWATCTRGVMIV